MNSAPAIAVVLFESRGYLDALLKSLRAQTVVAQPWAFCINGPDDGAAEFLRSQAEQIFVTERPDNPGFAGGANAAMALLERDGASPEFILLLNPDVELSADYLEHGLEVFNHHPEVGAVGGLLWRENATGAEVVDSAGFALQPWLRIVDRGAGRDLASWREPSGSVIGVCAAAILMRSAALRDVAEDGKAFDESFWMYKEDQDLCLRLRGRGHQVFFEPAARARHQRGWAPKIGARAGIAGKLRQHSLKNRYLLMAKHWDWRQLWRFPLILVFELFLGLLLLVSEPRTLRAYPMAARLWPTAWRKGRAFAKRRLSTAW
ncbi:MAG: glycosyltransferase [Planctomycetota bacterium]